jgi:hypothetical protein
MKTKTKILTIILGLILSSVVFTKQEVSAQGPQVSIQVFYDQLSPYGQWVNYPEYGFVWIPYAGEDFVPYSTGGHWIYTEYGWTWFSDYAWGWAPFHYGRWDYDNYYGWFWIPGNEWAPAWVSWRRSNGYYGWAPMEPGISISVSFGRGYDSRNDHWIFVRDRDIDRSDVNRYYVNRADHDMIIRNSTIINNTYIDNSRNSTYISGPGRDEVRKATGRRVNPVAVQENNKPGQDLSNGQYRTYRPRVMDKNDDGQRPAPSRVTNLNEVRRPSDRSGSDQPGRVNNFDGVKKERQQNNVNQQNANPQRETKQAEQQNTVKQQNTNPQRETKQAEQHNTVKQQNTNPQRETKQADQQNTVKQQNTNPQRETKQADQQNTVKQQSTNPKRETKQAEQQNTEKQRKSNTQSENKKEEKPDLK